MTAKLFSRRRRGDGPHSTQFAATILGLPDVELTATTGSRADAPNPDTMSPDSLVPDGSLANAAVPDVLTDIGGLPGEVPDPAHAPTLSHIGRYALKRQLGSGGLGAVFEAWDPLLSRVVAVKTLQFDIEHDARVSLDGLFLNEARAAASLNHRYIVTIHDAGLSAHGAYIAMERLYGRDLQHALAGGWRPTVEQSLQLVRRVAEALAYAHARGVVHCDIKPANIFLQRRDKPKVLDFGIARIVNGAVLPALEGAVVGSPRYRAPEQLTGAGIDARTDLFSLGVVMYELLTGRRAFMGETLAEINQAVLHHDPPPVHEIDPSVAFELSTIVSRLMARTPADRYTGASELSADLRRWMHGQQALHALPPALAARPLAEPAPSARSSMPRWLLATGLLLGAAAVAAGLMGPRAPQAAAPTPATLVSTAAPSALAVSQQPAVAEPAASLDMSTPDQPAGSADPALADAAPISPISPITLAAPIQSPSALALPPTVSPAAARLRLATDSPVIRNRQSALTDASAQGGRSDTSSNPSTAVAAPANGTVQLAVSPWCEVEVDGKPVGTTPPVTRLTLPEGAHTITLRNADFAPQTVQIQVTADKPVTLRHRFGS